MCVHHVCVCYVACPWSITSHVLSQCVISCHAVSIMCDTVTPYPSQSSTHALINTHNRSSTSNTRNRYTHYHTLLTHMIVSIPWVIHQHTPSLAHAIMTVHPTHTIITQMNTHTHNPHDRICPMSHSLTHTLLAVCNDSWDRLEHTYTLIFTHARYTRYSMTHVK